jgi:hypothetical protein
MPLIWNISQDITRARGPLSAGSSFPTFSAS